MTNESRGNDALEKIRHLIKDIDIGMLTTKGEDGFIRSRPMSSNGDVSEDGTIWFFTRRDSRLSKEIEECSDINAAFSNNAEHFYVSVSGSAELVTDKHAMATHWKPQLRAWFPDGLENPDIALLRVKLIEAEYWESRGGFISHTLSFARSLLGGKPLDTSEHGVAKGA